MMNYLLESSICLAAFYGFYWLILRNSKLLSVNRWYLLVSSLMALVFPLLQVTSYSLAEQPLPMLSMNHLQTQDLQGISLLQVLLWVYLAGLSLRLSSVFFRINQLLRLKGRVAFISQAGNPVIEVPGSEAFSFFKRIYIGSDILADSTLRKHIIQHESAHAKELHSLDLLYFDLLKAVFWFNPFAYCYASSIKIQHEYIADQAAQCQSSLADYEQSLIKMALVRVSPMLVSQFAQHPIEQRLIMLNKSNTNKMKHLKPILALPIAALLFVCFACTPSEPTATIMEEVPTESTDALSELQEVVFEEESPASESKIDDNAVVIIETNPVDEEGFEVVTEEAN